MAIFKKIKGTNIYTEFKKNKSGKDTMLANDIMSVHMDVKDLLWIADGPYRNCGKTEADEPSLLFTQNDFVIFEKEDVAPPYYPIYRNLSPEQKGMYWKFLRNPYDVSNEMGYVFLFYYGLERFLTTPKAELAFKEILRLRKVYKNKSFQIYSATAIAFACLWRNDFNFTNTFLNILEKGSSLLNVNVFTMLKHSINSPLKAVEIVNYAKQFGFTNTRYIKGDYDLFIEKLSSNIMNKFNSPNIYLNDFFGDNGLDDTIVKSLECNGIIVFANTSLPNRVVEIPDFLSHTLFSTTILSLLSQTHEDVKQSYRKRSK